MTPKVYNIAGTALITIRHESESFCVVQLGGCKTLSLVVNLGITMF